MEINEILKSKNQITKAGERFRDNIDTNEDWDIVAAFRQFRTETIEKELKFISKTLKNHKHVLGCRVKRVDTIIRKLKREENLLGWFNVLWIFLYIIYG